MTTFHPGGGSQPGWPHPDEEPGVPPTDPGPQQDVTVTRTPVAPTPAIGTPADGGPAEQHPTASAADPASLDVLAAAPAPVVDQKRGSKLPAPPRPNVSRRERAGRGKGGADRIRTTPGPSDNIPVKLTQRRMVPHLVAARINNMTLRARLGAFVSLVVGIAVAIVALSAFFLVRVQYYNAFDKGLVERARQLAETAAVGDQNKIVQFPGPALLAADIRVALIYEDTVPFYPQKAPQPPELGAEELAVAKRQLPISIRTATAENENGDPERFRIVAVPASEDTTRQAPKETKDENGDGEPDTEIRAAMVLAQSVEDTEDALRSLGTALLIMAVSGVALAAYTGYLVARQGLRPVERLTKAAEHVARTGELRPIDVAGEDELARLGSSFNAMLATVERSHDRQRRLVADAGHELRTPLTSLRMNLDLLAQAQTRGGLSDEDKTELLADVTAQVEELTGLVSDLVELARDDAEKSEDRPVDMADVVANAVERARRRAPDVTFDVRTRPWTVFGDARSLERAVLNLLDNAGKWSPQGGTVTVRLADGVISVADEGPGIAEADLPFVFERFYRADESRTMPGSGLGLAIVRQAAERHRGTVTADRAPQGGALLRLSLPHGSSVTHTEG